MESKENQPLRLAPTLGLFGATAISVGAIVGAGIFVITGITAGYAGSALVVSMLLAAIVSSFTALSFAELTASLPKEGSVYEFGRQLISPFAGFAGGWMWMLSNIFAGAAVSLGFAYYFTNLFSALPPRMVAAVVCLAFTALNFFGIRQSALFNNILVVAKLAILAFFSIFGLFFVNTSNYLPFAPFQPGVFVGAFYVFFAFGGFGRVAVVAEEVKDPKRNVPRAILLSLLISTVCYIAVGTVAVGLVGPHRLAGSNSPLTEAVSVAGNFGVVQIVSLGGLLATASVLITSVLGVSRMAYSMARGNDLPMLVSMLHRRYSTPYVSVWATGIIMTVLVLLVDLSSVVAISTFAMLFYYAMANISALRLQEKQRQYSRLVPILGTGSCITLFGFSLFISPQALGIGLAGFATGTIYYFVKHRAVSKAPRSS